MQEWQKVRAETLSLVRERRSVVELVAESHFEYLVHFLSIGGGGGGIRTRVWYKIED